MANITKEGEEIDTRQKSIKEPKSHDSTKIVKYLKDNFGELCNYDKSSKIVYICDNSILGDKKFIEFLTKYKVFIQPSLF